MTQETNANSAGNSNNSSGPSNPNNSSVPNAKSFSERARAAVRSHALSDYKAHFIDFMIDSNVIKFGQFTLKSGRQSPFFMNAGAYVTGEQLTALGEFYARAIHENFGDNFNVVFGPAYKGIPLSVITAMAYFKLYGKQVKYCSNRKEVKDHGEGGSLLGHVLQDGDRVVIVEDVTTTGKSIDETHPIITAAANIEVVGLMVSLNRMEVGPGAKLCATDEVSARFGFPVASIVNMQEVVGYLCEGARAESDTCAGESVLSSELRSQIDNYYAQYGVAGD